ncbi:hypothetical protein RJT34_19867 [Clitoria ternatea]|uniref:C3H1-type domain-containing protein n=1 Tax=Clitoria ternatea TaxID=43366 RepID=A0AAN9P453_CLITE
MSRNSNNPYNPNLILPKSLPSQPKVPVGVDPKSILCEFFKVGQCAKGFKCKFSHDLNNQRKGEILTFIVISVTKKQWRIGTKRLWRR